MNYTDDTLTRKQLTAISKFQKIIQRNNLIACIKRFRRFFIDTRNIALKKPTVPRTDNAFIGYHGKQFDILASRLENKTILKIVNAITKRIYTYLNVNFDPNLSIEELRLKIVAPQLSNRDLLSIFCFAGFPEFVLMKAPSELLREKDTLPYAMYNLSRKLLGSWGLLIESSQPKEPLRKFIVNLNIFATHYATFIYNDKSNQLKEYVMRWYGKEKEKAIILKSKSYDDLGRVEALNSIENDQKEVINYIKRIDSTFDLGFLETYKSVVDKTEQTTHECFWNMLRDDIKNGEFEFFCRLLSEIKTEVLNLLPKVQDIEKDEQDKVPFDKVRESFYNKFNRGIIEEEFKETFDIEHIKSMLKHNTYPTEEFLKLSEYILGFIKISQAPIRNKPMINEWNNLMEKINNNEISNIENQGVEIIKFLLHEIKAIKDNILELYTKNM